MMRAGSPHGLSRRSARLGSRGARRLGPVLGAVVVSACAARAAAPQGAARPEASEADPRASEVERYLPLKDDTVFTYAVWLPESPGPEQLILQVERRARGRASLRSGDSVKRLVFVADGVRLLTGGYLLKAPLAPGAEWAGPSGRVVVTAFDKQASVPAGTFVGCLETTETGGQGPQARSIVTTYCPEVGIVELRVDAEERFELLRFGPYVRIEELAD